MLIEYVRDQLRVALGDARMAQKNQVAIMADMAGGDRFIDKLTRNVGTASSPVQIDAEPVRYRLGKKFQQNKVLISETDFKSSIWRLSVGKLSELHGAWASYCYGGDLKFDKQVVILKEVWDRFLVRDALTGQKKMAAKTLARIQSLAWLAVQVAESQINGSPKEYSAAELSRMMGITPQNWHLNYAPRWALLIAVCLELDNEVIGYAARQQQQEHKQRRLARMLVQAGNAPSRHPSHMGVQRRAPGVCSVLPCLQDTHLPIEQQTKCCSRMVRHESPR
ncbi:bacteriophage antitermination protein Q [Nissabacter sp. SGAir0207]|uniref:bacteriophage antitermination protein Q n=1 Tax=Nissabacter sp. SGAir0207 TaxID=2126321 RepID=UPI0010CD3D8B|nr:bacteriophage antitermination protein Q [Nissabacter sp. SGAir0207]QCR38973.1 hypothetical protein C1N62_22950 [Nissabacter sp. SGAir0207]